MLNTTLSTPQNHNPDHLPTNRQPLHDNQYPTGTKRRQPRNQQPGQNRFRKRSRKRSPRTLFSRPTPSVGIIRSSAVNGTVRYPDTFFECIIRKTKRRTEINRSGPKLKRNVTRRKTKRTSGYAFLIGRPTLFSLQNRPGFAGVRADARRSPLHHSNYI